MTKYKAFAEVATRKLGAERYQAIRREVRDEAVALALRELREGAGLTQEQAAKAAEMTQSELSKLERRDDHLLSSLRRYIEALGGELEVVAVLNGKRVPLRGV